MPNNSISFDGTDISLPGSYYRDDVSAVLQTTASGTPPIILVGNCYGLEQNVPSSFSRAQDVTAALRGGPLSEFIPFLFSPSDSLNGASQVTVINAASNTSASITLKDSTGAAAINLTSANYGTPENLTQVAVSSGTDGGVLMTLYDAYSGATYSRDNLGVPFYISYAGSATSDLTISVTASNLTITSPNAEESISIPLGPTGYATVTDIVNYLNGTGFYTAGVTSESGNLPSEQLDPVTSAQFAPGDDYYVEAILNDPIYWMLNSVSSIVGTATIAEGYQVSSTTELAYIALTHFSGATNTAPMVSDYAAALNVALNIPGFLLFMDSNDSEIMALGTQHVKTASSIAYGRDRRFITGSSLGIDAAAAVKIAKSLATKEVTFVHPGIWRTDTTTLTNTLYSGLHAAAAIAGMISGNDVNMALTNKPLTGNGVETTYVRSDLVTLLQGGVMPITLPDSAVDPTVLIDVTTHQADNNVENVYNQQVGMRQYLSYVLIAATQPYTGGIQSTTNIARQRNAVVAALNGQIYTGSGAGILDSWDSTSLVLSYDGTTQRTKISVNVTFVGQVVYQTITAYVQPLNLTSSTTTA